VDDVNADGAPDILIGAPMQHSQGNVTEGRAYVYSGRTGALLHTFANPSPQDGARFGFRFVELGGDANGDGIPDLLLGAFKQDVAPAQPLLSEAHGPGHGVHCPLDDRFPMRSRPGAPEPSGVEANEGQAFLYVSRMR
jgi:hypothetical protein